jgi:beta-galactosidase
VGESVEEELIVGLDRQRIGLNHDWRFSKGDPLEAEQIDYDDSTWRVLDIPHDWAIEGAFDKKYNPQTGGLDIAGVGWYRKHFRLSAPGASRVYTVEIDGAMANARVFLNGREIGARPYGYIGFAVDITSHLRFGEAANVLAFRLAPEDQASRWYPGAGLYRHVWLDVTADVHIARWGTVVTTSKVSAAAASVNIRTEIRNHRAAVAEVTLESAIIDADGRSIARIASPHRMGARSSKTTDTRLELPRPRLWDVDNPHLYAAVSLMREREEVLDRYTTVFGVRTLEFNKSKGFVLNGRHRKLRGVCLHHDLGALGAAVNRRAIERQLQLMKAMGANAIRTSHNPPAPELLEECDRLGLMVVDEAFDMWRRPKVAHGYSKIFDAWGETDLRDMIRRDRNHPSVILWSIGNEILEQNEPDGWKIARRLTEICHEEDPSRPVTAAFNQPREAIQNGLAGEVDIPGFNYQPLGYEGFLRDHPDWIVVGSETCSCVSSRGIYHLPLEKYDKHPSLQLTSYDIIAPRWGYPPDVEFDAQERSPNVLGEFVWTGFDYLGEPTPYFWQDWQANLDEPDWPSRSSYFGIVDLAGFPKDRYFLYQSVWTERPMVHLLPHWNWEGREAQAIPVMVYTNGDEAELFVNGRSLGRQKRTSGIALPVGASVSPDGTFQSKYRLLWRVPYEAGTLKAVAFAAGNAVAIAEVRTAGPPARLHVASDRSRLRADGEDLAFLSVQVQDQQGTLCPLSGHSIAFQIDGAGTLAGVDNGNPASVEPFQSKERRAFAGRCLLIVRPNRGASGQIRVLSTSEGLQGAETRLEVDVEAPRQATTPRSSLMTSLPSSAPHRTGYFGPFGGRFVAETLVPALDELAAALDSIVREEPFQREWRGLLASYAGRPTPLGEARRLSRAIDPEGSRIGRLWLKREDLCHTGAHKINNALGQVLLAKKMGKTRVIAETGAGQHGVATATACALFGLPCEVYMGAEDVKRQSPNVGRMKLLGARVVPVVSGSRTLKDAMNEAMRDWVTNVRSTYYCIGSVAGPHPYPELVAVLQSVIGEEARAQSIDTTGELPDAVMACVGGGSNAMGMFGAFLQDDGVALVGVEAAGEGVSTGRHAATLSEGRVGVLHGSKSYVLCDDGGQILEAHSISAGLDYPGVGPQHAWLKESGRARYLSATDAEALASVALVAQNEGIIPALESAHAFARVDDVARELARARGRPVSIAVCLSGRGDKDLSTLLTRLLHDREEQGPR